MLIQVLADVPSDLVKSSAEVLDEVFDRFLASKDFHAFNEVTFERLQRQPRN